MPDSFKNMTLVQNLARAAQAIKNADALLITAGAGMGVDSGLPDFRGKEGFWKAYPAIAGLGLSFADMANPSWFKQSPELAWAFYGHRLNLYRTTTPHPGFNTLLEMGQQRRLGYFVFTSNVDGQFQKAGFDRARIVECHGSIHHFQCCVPCKNEIWEAGGEQVNLDEATFRAKPPLPGCRSCGELARPNILMFSDTGWVDGRTDSQEHSLTTWLNQLQESEAKLAVIELGAGTSIPTVRLVSETIVGKYDGTLIRINVREEKVPPAQIGLGLGAADGIARIWKDMQVAR